MANTLKPGPIEVWLTKGNIGVTCKVVYEDETIHSLDVDALSMRGAQREVTGWLINEGYTPAARWKAEAADDDEGVLESVRSFRPAPAK